jgi:alkanesulfonate monooxygenase SsuD/methylene tetrahydromethanopterin reductase-like flavin-dependent oxidoreductase (luciferase family)
MWTQEEAVFEGKYYQLHGAINQPKGVQQPHIPMLIGGGGEQVTLKLVAQYGDACNVNGDLATLQRKFAVLKQHCESVGRDYESIHRTITGFCSIGETDEQARAKVPQALLRHMGNRMNAALIGSPDTIRKGLAELEAIGVQEVILGFTDSLSLDALRFFAKEFITR